MRQRQRTPRIEHVSKWELVREGVYSLLLIPAVIFILSLIIKYSDIIDNILK